MFIHKTRKLDIFGPSVVILLCLLLERSRVNVFLCRYGQGRGVSTGVRCVVHCTDGVPSSSTSWRDSTVSWLPTPQSEMHLCKSRDSSLVQSFTRLGDENNRGLLRPFPTTLTVSSASWDSAWGPSGRSSDYLREEDCPLFPVTNVQTRVPAHRLQT